MGLQDRDYWRDAHKARSSTSRHFMVLLVWLVLMGALYVAFDRVLAPPKPAVTATGNLHIPRSRDGHFYIEGTVNGRPVEFLVDTGASSVFVSEQLAQSAALSGGTPTAFHTANGTVQGRTVARIPVTAGPLSVSAVSVGVGLRGGNSNQALLGQNFLSKFNVSISQSEMVIQPR